jgi:hypothetical protein
MKLELDPEDLKPLVQAVVNEAIAQLRADEAKLNGRLAFTEPEAAALIGVPRHSLRDARLRNEIRASLSLTTGAGSHTLVTAPPGTAFGLAVGQ